MKYKAEWLLLHLLKMIFLIRASTSTSTLQTYFHLFFVLRCFLIKNLTSDLSNAPLRRCPAQIRALKLQNVWLDLCKKNCNYLSQNVILRIFSFWLMPETSLSNTCLPRPNILSHKFPTAHLFKTTQLFRVKESRSAMLARTSIFQQKQYFGNGKTGWSKMNVLLDKS